MKISEMTNEQAADALIRLSVPFGNICDDEKMVGMIDEFNRMKNIPVIQTVGKIIPKVVTYALKEHKEDVYEIVGALTMKTMAQVAEMNFIETIKVFKDSYDEVLQGFFTSSTEQIKKTVEASSQG